MDIFKCNICGSTSLLPGICPICAISRNLEGQIVLDETTPTEVDKPAENVIIEQPIPVNDELINSECDITVHIDDITVQDSYDVSVFPVADNDNIPFEFSQPSNVQDDPNTDIRNTQEPYLKSKKKR